MGLIDKFKKAIRPDDSDYDSSPDEMYNYGNDEDDDVIINGNMSNNNSIYNNNNMNNMQYPDMNSFPNNSNHANNNNSGNNSGFMPNGGNNHHNQNASLGLTMTSQASVEMKLESPKEFNDVKPIATHLLQRKTIIMNLENANKETRKRLMDFLGGVAFAIDGQIKPVSNDTVIIAPSDVDISGDTPRPVNRRNDDGRNDGFRGNNNYNNDDDIY